MNKIRKIGKVSIINNEKVIKKEKNNDEIFEYLESRSFDNYLKPIERSDERTVYPYIKDKSVDKYQKGEDLIKTVALLHTKTSFNKEINPSKYKEIHDNIIGHINYLDKYFYEYLDKTELIEYPSPSDTIFLRNYSKLLSLFDFLKQETDTWYKLAKNNTKKRVALNHGNLNLDHLLKNDKDYLISWDNATFDSPILDITNLYHNEWNHIDFSSALKNYLDRCSLSEDEKKLLFINLAIPKKIEKTKDEMINVMITSNLFDYIYKTEELIRPYYTEKQEKQ